MWLAAVGLTFASKMQKFWSPPARSKSIPARGPLISYRAAYGLGGERGSSEPVVRAVALDVAGTPAYCNGVACEAYPSLREEYQHKEVQTLRQSER